MSNGREKLIATASAHLSLGLSYREGEKPTVRKSLTVATTARASAAVPKAPWSACGLTPPCFATLHALRN